MVRRGCHDDVCSGYRMLPGSPMLQRARKLGPHLGNGQLEIILGVDVPQRPGVQAVYLLRKDIDRHGRNKGSFASFYILNAMLASTKPTGSFPLRWRLETC